MDFILTSLRHSNPQNQLQRKRLSQCPDLLVAKATDDMIVDHAGGLHVGIANSWPQKDDNFCEI
jgi:hypothetical protein